MAVVVVVDCECLSCLGSCLSAVLLSAMCGCVAGVCSEVGRCVYVDPWRGLEKVKFGLFGGEVYGMVREENGCPADGGIDTERDLRPVQQPDGQSWNVSTTKQWRPGLPRSRDLNLAPGRRCTRAGRGKVGRVRAAVGLGSSKLTNTYL